MLILQVRPGAVALNDHREEAHAIVKLYGAPDGPGFLDKVYAVVEDEVERQLELRLTLDADGEPNFNDVEYLLAASAAALKELTHYGTLSGKDVEHEVFSVRNKNAKSDFVRALSIVCDTLIPRRLDNSWQVLSVVERHDNAWIGTKKSVCKAVTVKN